MEFCDGFILVGSPTSFREDGSQIRPVGGVMLINAGWIDGGQPPVDDLCKIMRVKREKS